MKERYIRLNKRIYDLYALETATKVKDRWGTIWIANSFSIDSFTGGKSIYIRYWRDKLPLFKALKRLDFNDDGKLYCNVCNKKYCLGTWEIK